MASRQRLEEYLFYINNLLKQEDFYDSYANNISAGKSDFKITQRFYKKKYDLEWIDFIEDCLVPMDTIVRNPRKFIVIEEDIVDISLARNISTESVKHLATHTNLISSVNEQGMVIPSKILNTSKEETYEVYENRFIYTLLLKVVDFVRRRFDVIKKADAQSDEMAVTVKSEYAIDDSKFRVNWDTAINTKLDNMLNKEGEDTLNNVERVSKIHTILSSFLASPFAKEMVSCAPVRPPIQRTNVIMKNPNFKKMLTLWQFVESYDQMGFEVVTINDSKELSPSGQDKLRNLLLINSLVMDTLLRRSAEEEFYTPEEQEEQKEEEKANEFITKEIDDFVPDDFPYLRMDLFETRKVYVKKPNEKKLTALQAQKINAAIDRALTQFQINKAKQDSERQKKLILKQIKETELAKKRALREAAIEAKRQERQRILDEKERIRAEKQAERDRKLAEAKQKEEEIRLAQELHDKMLKEQEEAMRERLRLERIASEDRIRRDELRIARIMEDERKRIEIERRLMKEQAERERAGQAISGYEAEAMLAMKRKEIQRIREMRLEQERLMHEMLEGHYRELEQEQQDLLIDMQIVRDIEEFEARGESLPDVDIENFAKGEIESMMYNKPVEEKFEETEEVEKVDDDEDSLVGRSFGLAFDDDDLTSIDFDSMTVERIKQEAQGKGDDVYNEMKDFIKTAVDDVKTNRDSNTIDLGNLVIDEKVKLDVDGVTLIDDSNFDTAYNDYTTTDPQDEVYGAALDANTSDSDAVDNSVTSTALNNDDIYAAALNAQDNEAQYTDNDDIYAAALANNYDDQAGDVENPVVESEDTAQDNKVKDETEEVIVPDSSVEIDEEIENIEDDFDDDEDEETKARRLGELVQVGDIMLVRSTMSEPTANDELELGIKEEDASDGLNSTELETDTNGDVEEQDNQELDAIADENISDAIDELSVDESKDFDNTQEPIEESLEEVYEEDAEETIDESVEEKIDESVEEAIDESVEEVFDETVEETMHESESVEDKIEEAKADESEVNDEQVQDTEAVYIPQSLDELFGDQQEEQQKKKKGRNGLFKKKK